MKNVHLIFPKVFRRSNFFVFLLLGISMALHAQTLVWSEEFSDASINTDVWTYDFGTGSHEGVADWGNSELQYYTSRTDNVYTSGGSLIIEAKSETFDTKSFTSGRINTEGRMHFKYGTLEARIKIPNLADGLWPAYWLMGVTGGTWPANGEIDVAEWGHADAITEGVVNKRVGGAAHWEYADSYAGYGNSGDFTTDLNNDFHIYKLVWTESLITCYVDDMEYYAIDISDIEGNDMEEFHNMKYLILNLAVGGTYTGITDVSGITASLPAQMVIDYIRLYQDDAGELWIGADEAECGEYGVYTETTSVSDHVVYGTEANLYTWNGLTTASTPAFEGNEVMSFTTTANTWFGLGVNVEGRKNMNKFYGGALKFHLKTDAPGNLTLGISTGHGDSWISLDASHGYSNDNTWNEITIPFSEFYNLDLGSVKQLFMITGDVPTTSFNLDIDNIYYSGGEECSTSTGTPVTDVSLSSSAISLTEGGTQQLAATVSPSNADDASVSWSSSNTSAATVSSSGLVTAVGQGSAIITITTTDGSYTATCAVTVSEATSETAYAVSVGSGSYASVPPENEFIGGNEIYGTFYDFATNSDSIDVAADKKSNPIPTNDWWTSILTQEDASGNRLGGNLWTFPLVSRATTSGFEVGHRGQDEWYSDSDGSVSLGVDYLVGITGSSFAPTKTIAMDWSDWHVDLRTQVGDDESNRIDVTLAQGMPYVWLKTFGFDPVISAIHAGVRNIYDESGNSLSFPATTDRFVIEYDNNLYGIHFSENVTIQETADGFSINGYANKWLVVSALNNVSDLSSLHQYAFVKPTSTSLDYTYNPNAGTVTAIYNITTEVLAGSETNALQGFIPHHYRGDANDFSFTSLAYSGTSRGTMKCAVGSSFTFNYAFNADFLPHFNEPEVDGSESIPYDADIMNEIIDGYAESVESGISGGTYWGGKNLLRMIKYTLMAKETGNSNYGTLLEMSKDYVYDWLTYTVGEEENYYSYYPAWKALIGFNEEYYSAYFTDNHFHCGYIVHAAALLEMAEPGSMDGYWDMLTMIVKTYANWDKNDSEFPYMRTFSPWMGHSFASGLGNTIGNNQESTSESMQAWAGMFMVAEMTGNTEMRDAAAFGYLTEGRAIADYWYNESGVFDEVGYEKPVTGILEMNRYVYGTFFGAQDTYIHGIQWLPITPAYGFWNDFLTTEEANAIVDPIMNNMATDLEGTISADWMNVCLGFKTFFDPEAVVSQFDGYWNNSDAASAEYSVAHTPGENGLTYYYSHATQNMGLRQSDYRLSMPLSSAFEKDGVMTYVVYNTSNSAQTCVVYENDTQIESFTVPANTLFTTTGESAISVSGVSLSPTATTVRERETTQLTAIISPSNATNQGVSYSSSNEAVATVNASGIVSGITQGVVTITVTTNDGGFTTTSEVTVTEGSASTINIALDQPAYASTEEDASTTSATNAVDGDLTSRWSSLHEDPQWIYVDLGESYTISQVSLMWETALASDYEIQVSDDAVNWTTIESITGNSSYNADYKGLSATGQYVRIYGTARGTEWGYSLYELEVYGVAGSITPVTGVSLSPTSATLTEGETRQLTTTVSPAAATDQSVSYTSSNTSVASVSSSGLITAIADGNATITVTTIDGSLTATCNVTVNASSTLPSPWATLDIGDVSAEGSASYSNGIFNIEGSGADIWNTADEFRYVYQNISGDVTITARVVSLENTNNWAKAGVMIRESLDAGSKHAMAIMASTAGTSFQRRTTTNGTSAHSTVSGLSAPYWVRLVRSGDTFTSYYSSDGINWTSHGSATVSMSPGAFVGLVTTSHDDGVLCSSEIDNVTISSDNTIDVTGVSLSATSVTLAEGETQQLIETVSPSDATDQSVSYSSSNTSIAAVSSNGLVTAISEGNVTITVTTTDGGFTATCNVTVNAITTLPSPWATIDIGDVSAEGAAAYSNGTFSIEGSGADIWGTADEFRYVYQEVSDDVTITARVASVENTNVWAKAGVMIRESLDAGSKHAMSVITPSKGTSFQRRVTTGGTSLHSTNSTVSAPYWVRIVRSGDTFTSYYSADGNTWTSHGSETITMSSGVYIGLVTTSHSDGVLCASEIDNVTVTSANTIDVTGVSLSLTSVTLTEGETQQLTETVSPADADDTGVSYSSSNSSVATVSSGGLVTAIAEGSATISVTTNDGNYTATCVVSVEAITIELTNLALNKNVIVSDEPEALNPGTNAVDGDVDTRWSATGMPQWLEVDLGAIYSISRTEIVCYNDRDYQFIIEISTDGSTYTELVDRSDNTDLGSNDSPITDEFTEIDARYVRITVSGAATYTGTWVSLEELRVFGNASTMKSAEDESFADNSSTNASLYPNPATDILNIASGSKGVKQIQVFDLTGNKIGSYNSNQNFIYVNELTSGVYYIRIEHLDGAFSILRFIKR